MLPLILGCPRDGQRCETIGGTVIGVAGRCLRRRRWSAARWAIVDRQPSDLMGS